MGFELNSIRNVGISLKMVLCLCFTIFFIGHLQLFHLNFGTIALLPKKDEAVRIEQFRPICLLNVSCKIFTKVGTNRLTQIAHSMIQPSQTVFMSGRHILEGVVVLHERFMRSTPRNWMGLSSKWTLRRRMIK